MNFLAPWHIPLIAAAATVPPLVLLYFLKLRRREVPIASTLLWKRAVQDLQVNAPFQRIRNNLLLILQLLLLLAAILAICEPMLEGSRPVDKAIVLLIDRSASMNTREEDGRTRLEIAREEALKVVDDMTTDQRAMLITFGERADILSAFTDDTKQLRRQIEQIAPSDSIANFREAMQLAEAHSTPTGEGVDISGAFDSSNYLVFTDGRLDNSREVEVKRGTMELIRIGQAADNVGLVSLDVRRNYERPEEVTVLARARNFGTTPSQRDVSLFVDGRLEDVRTLPELAPLAPAESIGEARVTDIPPAGNEATATFHLILETAAEIEVRLSGSDALPADDRAYAVAVPPSPITALVVTPGNMFLRELLDAFQGNLLSSFDVWTPDEYEEADDTDLIAEGRCRYSVVIIDGHSTERLPPGGYVFLDGIPLVDGVEIAERIPAETFLDWDDTHPVLRHVAIGPIVIASRFDITLPEEAVTLVEDTAGPVIGLLNRRRSQYLICAFGFFNEERNALNTEWVFSESLVVFMSNALRYLAGSSTIGQQPSVRPGEAFTVDAAPGTDTVTVRAPDGRTESVRAQPSGLVTYGQTDQVGIYAIETGIAGQDARAVNLLNESESFIAPNQDFRVAAGEVATSEGLDRVNRPLWPFLLMAFGAILLIEWIVYNKRMFV